MIVVGHGGGAGPARHPERRRLRLAGPRGAREPTWSARPHGGASLAARAPSSTIPKEVNARSSPKTLRQTLRGPEGRADRLSPQAIAERGSRLTGRSRSARERAWVRSRRVTEPLPLRGGRWSVETVWGWRALRGTADDVADRRGRRCRLLGRGLTVAGSVVRRGDSNRRCARDVPRARLLARGATSRLGWSGVAAVTFPSFLPNSRRAFCGGA